MVMLGALCLPTGAQDVRERMEIEQTFKGKVITITGELTLPSCMTQHYKPKTTGAPIYLLLGGADTYVGVAPCEEYAAALKAEGTRIETVVYQGAMHGFDGQSAYQDAKGENYSRCMMAQQPDGTWREQMSGITTNDASGKRIEAGYKQALAKCMTHGVRGGPNAAAKAKAMAALKAYVQRHLLEKGP
jgi:dienelactone hydrolase